MFAWFRAVKTYASLEWKQGETWDHMPDIRWLEVATKQKLLRTGNAGEAFILKISKKGFILANRWT